MASEGHRAPARPFTLCRSWLFLPGAERARLEAAAGCGADVLIQELEDFTPPERRPEAHSLSTAVLAGWKQAGRVAAVRINPLDKGGMDDLAAVMPARPDIVMMSMVSHPGQIAALDAIVRAHEQKLGIAEGSTPLCPNIETAAGLVAAGDIFRASPRVAAALLASEDMAADLGAERTPGGAELAYVRQRFLVECTAAGIVAIDCPCTFASAETVAADTGWARSIGYKAKSLVNPDHAAVVNAGLTPSTEAVAHARRIVAAFEAARARGEDRALLDGHAVEVPTYRAARRTLERAAALGIN